MNRYWLRCFFVLFLSLGFLSPAEAGVSVGDQAPDFSLPDINGNTHSLSDFDGHYRVLEWVNHDCPFVKKHYGSDNMQSLQEEYTGKEVVWLSINSSAPGKQGNYSAEEWQALNAEKGSAATAVLLDPAGEVGKLYGAQTTPHMYIIDPSGTLVYQGAIDSIASADPGDIPKAVNFVSQALEESMGGRPVTQAATKAYGCSVKY